MHNKAFIYILVFTICKSSRMFSGVVVISWTATRLSALVSYLIKCSDQVFLFFVPVLISILIALALMAYRRYKHGKLDTLIEFTLKCSPVATFIVSYLLFGLYRYTVQKCQRGDKDCKIYEAMGVITAAGTLLTALYIYKMFLHFKFQQKSK
jgi:hypothetical protein